MNTRELAEFLRTDVESINAGEPPLSVDMIETYLREYKERVCREQRELCAKEAEIEYHWRDGEAYLNTDDIRNAPQPEE
jgi:hypothetical protein